MALKERQHGKFHNKFCNVVDQLIVLQELGFVEDSFHNWNYVIYQGTLKSKHFSKSLVASGDYLYLRDQQGADVPEEVLWQREHTRVRSRDFQNGEGRIPGVHDQPVVGREQLQQCAAESDRGHSTVCEKGCEKGGGDEETNIGGVSSCGGCGGAARRKA